MYNVIENHEVSYIFLSKNNDDGELKFLNVTYNKIRRLSQYQLCFGDKCTLEKHNISDKV